MTGPSGSGFIASLGAEPPASRRDLLEREVSERFRKALLMEDDEVLSLTATFFDLGLSSLRVTEVRQRLEQELGCVIDATVLFNQPTIAQLLVYLTAGQLAAYFPPVDGRATFGHVEPVDEESPEKARARALLSDLFGL